MVENDFEANEQRRPRAPRQESDDEAVNSNVGDPVDDNIDHPPDLEEDKDETNNDDKEIVIPPDPAHEAKMAALRAENAACEGSVHHRRRRPQPGARREPPVRVPRHSALVGVLPSAADRDHSRRHCDEH